MLTFLSYVEFISKALGIIAVTGLVAIGADMTYYYVKGSRDAKNKAIETKTHISDMLEKEKIRRRKERDAAEGYFEESYAWVLSDDNVWSQQVYRIPTIRGMRYMREMDRLHDAVIFHNTEEL